MTINSDSLSEHLAQGGVLLHRYDAVWSHLWRQTHVPADVLELCRLRLAKLHGAQADMALRKVPLGEERIEAVLSGRYTQSALFTAAELAVLELTDVYAQDPAAISDDMAARIKAHFGEAGLVCLVEALGFIDGRLRLTLMFDAMHKAQD